MRARRGTPGLRHRSAEHRGTEADTEQRSHREHQDASVSQRVEARRGLARERGHREEKYDSEREVICLNRSAPRFLSLWTPGDALSSARHCVSLSPRHSLLGHHYPVVSILQETKLRL